MSRFVIEGCGLLSMYILNQNKLFITERFSAANETFLIRRHITAFYKTVLNSKTRMKWIYNIGCIFYVFHKMKT